MTQPDLFQTRYEADRAALTRALLACDTRSVKKLSEALKQDATACLKAGS